MKKRKKMIALICIAVVFLLLIVWFCIPYSPLKADFEKDVEVLKTENQLYADGEVFTTADFGDFPIAIQKYIENNGYIGKSKMNCVRMEYNDVAFSQGRNGLNLTIDYTQYDSMVSGLRKL
jgi:hypothetical protein